MDDTVGSAIGIYTKTEWISIVRYWTGSNHSTTVPLVVTILYEHVRNCVCKAVFKLYIASKFPKCGC